jgi:hypothetical protein
MHRLARCAKRARFATPFRAWAVVGAALALLAPLAGCGAEGQNLPSSVRGSLSTSVGSSAGTLPGSLPGSLPESLPTRPDSAPPSQPETTPPPPASSAAAPPPTTTTSTTTTAGTEKTTVIVPVSAAAESSSDSTPWGWILAGVAFLVAAVAIAAVALSRRGAAKKSWQEQAYRATVQGGALHDGAVAELIAANSANRPERWSALDGDAGDLSMSLQTLQASSDGPQTTAVLSTLSATADFRSAAAVAGSAPQGTPLEPEAGRTLRQRLEQLSVALEALRAQAVR